MLIHDILEVCISDSSAYGIAIRVFVSNNKHCGGCINGYFKKVAGKLGLQLEAEFTDEGCKMRKKPIQKLGIGDKIEHVYVDCEAF